MKIKKTKVDKKLNFSERPYYINNDNEKSGLKIERPNNYAYYKGISELVQDKNITKALVIENYFDTDSLSKIKKESIQYPINDKLED